MKTILLPLLVDESVEAALATAHMIAKRYGSYIEGLFIRSAPPMVPRAPVPAHFLSQYHDYWDENADKARESFSAFMNEHGIAFRELASDE
nr:hypothetical protein [Alphaproteobacteria bacterium]